MRTIWLASYPKSGNTWMRLLIANLTRDAGEPTDINRIPFSGGIASSRVTFEGVTLIDSSLLDFDEIDALRPGVYAALNNGGEDRDDESEDHDTADSDDLRFVKAHDAYSMLPSGQPLLGGAGAAEGAIVIVRDPRDVAPSFANHSDIGIDDAIDLMSDSMTAFCGRRDRLHRQLRQRLCGWSEHVESWLGQRDIPVHLVRYEDMQDDPAAALEAALAFAGGVATPDAIDRAARLAAFDAVAAQERDHGFREAPRGARFFRRGIAGGWRDELTMTQIARIESAHAPMMRRLGYETVTTQQLAQAG